MECEKHEDVTRRIDDHAARLDIIESAIGVLQTGSAAKEEQIKTIFAMLGEIKQMLRDYTIEMKTSMGRLADDIEKIKGRPTRFIDGAVSAGIAALMGALVMFILGGR